MLLIASALIPFLLNIHASENGALTILGTNFSADKLNTIFIVWWIALAYFWLLFAARFIEEISRARTGVQDLKTELMAVSEAQKQLFAFGEQIKSFENDFKKFNLSDRFDEIREGGRLETITESIKSASEGYSKALADFKTAPIPTEHQCSNPDFDSETIEALHSSFGAFQTHFKDSYSILPDWKNLIDLYRQSLEQALNAEETTQGLKQIQKFRKTQHWAVKIRWLLFDAWLPLGFGVAVLIWVGMRIAFSYF